MKKKKRANHLKQSKISTVSMPKNIKTMRLFLTVFSLLAFNIIFAQQDWELRKNEDNIKVFTKKKKGYPLKASKVTTVMETTLPRLVAVLMDADNFYKVVPTSKNSKLLKIISDSERIYYVSTKSALADKR